MSKHTPGPWTVVSEGMASPKVVDANGLGICHTTYAPTGAEANARLIADAPRMRDLLAACEPYLKDGETPAHRIQRERLDNFAALELLAREKRKTEALLHAAKVCLMAERERRAALLPGAPATTYCEKRIALIEAAIKEAEGTT